MECLSCGGETARYGMSCGALEPHAAGGGLCHRRSRRCRRPDKEAELAQNNVMASCLQKRAVCQLAVALKTGHAYLRIRTTEALCAVYQENDLGKATVTAVAKKRDLTGKGTLNRKLAGIWTLKRAQNVFLLSERISTSSLPFCITTHC